MESDGNLRLLAHYIYVPRLTPAQIFCIHIVTLVINLDVYILIIFGVNRRKVSSNLSRKIRRTFGHIHLTRKRISCITNKIIREHQNCIQIWKFTNFSKISVKPKSIRTVSVIKKIFGRGHYHCTIINMLLLSLLSGSMLPTPIQ